MATGYSSGVPHIVLTADQLRIMREANGSVELRDEAGARVGIASPPDGHGWSAEDIAIAKARLATPGPQYTIDHVMARLDSLERQ